VLFLYHNNQQTFKAMNKTITIKAGTDVKAALKARTTVKNTKSDQGITTKGIKFIKSLQTIVMF